MSATPTTLFARSGSNRLYHFDFSRHSERAAGETILTATVTADAALTVGSPVIDGDFVQVRITGGAAGTTYAVTCAVTTSGGNTLSQVGYLAIDGGGTLSDPLGVDGGDYLGVD